MKYVVLFQRPNRIPNMDEWFDDRNDAERRCSEFIGMLDWLYESNNKVEGPSKVWIEEKE